MRDQIYFFRSSSHRYIQPLETERTAAINDDAHAATLNTFLGSFGDVMTTDDVVQRPGRRWRGGSQTSVQRPDTN